MLVTLLLLLLTALTRGVNVNLAINSSDNIGELPVKETNVFKVEDRTKRDTQHGGEGPGNNDNAAGNNGNAAGSHGNTGGSHGNFTGSHGNASGHHGNDSHNGGHHGIHVASWNFEEIQTPFFIGLFLFVSAMCKIGFHQMSFLSSFIPESCLLIVLGLIVGGVLRAFHDDHAFFEFFTPKLFFYFLLPPIILESAYSLHDRIFSQNLGTIILYAVVGTVLNCLIIGGLLYFLAWVKAMGYINITPVECLVFSALIVAVDPVAVLAIFQDIGVNNVLYFLVFGESLFNDAVTVVLYKVMIAFNQMDSIPPTQILLGLAAFLTVSIGGLCIGIILGLLTAFITKYTEHVRVVEPLLILVLAYMSYLGAEMFHFSGIISIIGCGLVQAQYAFHNVCFKSETTVTYFIKMLSASCDCIIFLFLGVALVKGDVFTKENWHTGFTLWALFLCIIVRFAVVYALTYLANCFNPIRKIHWTEQFIMAYGGLRGAVAFSLVVMLENVRHQGIFMTTTLIIIMFTVFIQGISMKPMVKLLRIKRKDDTISICDEINTCVTDHITSGIEEIVGQVGQHYTRELVDHLDDKYFKVWFQKDPQTKDDYIMDLYQKIALQQHFENTAGSPDALERYGSAMNLYEPELHVAQRFLERRDGTAFHEIALDPELMGRNLDLISRRRSSAVNPSAVRLRKQRTISSKEDGLVPDVEEPKPAKGRRRSTVAKLFARKDTQEEPEFVENPTAHNVRKWLAKNPGKEMFHRKYDRNLSNEDQHDLLHHLYLKQLRNDRLIRHMGDSYDLRTPDSASGRSSEYRSTEHLPGLRPVAYGPGQVLAGSPDPRRLPPGERPHFRRGPIKAKTIDIPTYHNAELWKENEKDGPSKKRPLKDIERTRLYRRSVPDEETILEGSEDSSSENEETPMLPKHSLKAPFLRGHTIATPVIQVDDAEEPSGPTELPTGPSELEAPSPELPTISEISDSAFLPDSKSNHESQESIPECPKGSRESLTLPAQYQSDAEGYPDLTTESIPECPKGSRESLTLPAQYQSDAEGYPDLSTDSTSPFSGSLEDGTQNSEDIPLQNVPEHKGHVHSPPKSRSPSPGSASRSMHKIPSLGQMGKAKRLDEADDDDR